MLDAERPLEVPIDSLSPEALEGILHNFILREGTDYGLNEVSLEKKVEQLKGQILRGEVLITFDRSTESVSLMNRRDWQKLKK